ESAPDKFLLMDKDTISIPGGRSSVEFCDLYTIDRHIIHVKRYRGSSSSLSHLFAQALVSAEIFSGDIDFRKAVNAKLEPDFTIPHIENTKRDDYEIVFAIIRGPARPTSLLSFARLNLMRTCQRLSGYGIYFGLFTRICGSNLSRKRRK
ncbi:MAG: hypothetical protein GY906_28265, partial [bacterium]|nr:hypothetical protein [bacterium]